MTITICTVNYLISHFFRTREYVRYVFPFPKKFPLYTGYEKMSDIGAEVLEEIFSRHNEIVAAHLFGSYARGYTGPNSDIDIGLLLSDNQLWLWKISCTDCRELKEACKTKCNIEMRILNNGTLRFLHQVLKADCYFAGMKKHGSSLKHR